MNRVLLGAMCLARIAAADPDAPLAQPRDDQALAATLAEITSDPAIPVTDPKARAVAQALMTEGVKQVRASHYGQGLANFLEAYAKFPSPRILVNIGSTLYDMRRFADAANTYQRYLFDPIAQRERLAEVRALLTTLDSALTILTIRVYPASSELSIDGGPFIAVAHSLQTRVRPGTHTVRVRKGGAVAELTLNGFEGENKEVIAQLPGAAVDQAPIDPAQTQHEWLQSGREFTTDTTGHRQVNSGYGGPVLVAQLPHFDDDDFARLTVAPVSDDDAISSGVLGLMRIDGKGRGVAAGVGVVVARERFEGELLLLRSDETGAYLGGRYRFLTGQFRPYAAIGIPLFVFSAVAPDAVMATTRVGIGARVAAGIEMVVNGHLSVQADLGFEHFWGISDTQFEPNLFVPTVGVIGRM